ncbi:MAG: 2Fe-2S iron-sulfur cluster-binding protein [Terriglobales bacterium]
MNSQGSPLYPYERLVNVTVDGRQVVLPENNSILRGLQFLAPEDISVGHFCWNEHCHTCLIEYDMGEGTEKRAAHACRLAACEGMRIRPLTPELKYRVQLIQNACAETEPRR